MSTLEFYQLQLHSSEEAITKETKIFRLWAIIRLALFILLISVDYFLWKNWIAFIPFTLLDIVAFLYAVSKFQDAKINLSKARKWKELVEYEIKAVEDEDYSNFENGVEFKDSRHPFSNDLDLFGERSIYQFLNRTFSKNGKIHLAGTLQKGIENPKFSNQIIESLNKEMGWCLKFRVNGSLNERKEALDVNLSEISRFNFSNPKWMKSIRFILAFLGLGTCIAYSFSFISGYLFAASILLNLIVVGKYVGSTNAIIRTLTDYEGKIQFLLDQMQLLQKLDTKDEELKSFIEKITSHGDGAIDSLKHLLKIQKKFEYRMNLLVGFVLNSLIVWDLQQRVALEKWMKLHQQKVGNWEQSLIELETYISGATIRFNHPETHYANFNENNKIEVFELVHPLINKKKVVANDVHFDENHQLMILTGPNMAGKSTYLRAVGLLFVLANSGFPIFAKSVNIPHYSLYSSMRTSDDLSHESSYFHSELSRLRFILDKIEAGEKVFILLDEILKGTNSIDKERGSKLFLQRLRKLNVNGIIATHDLSLCELSEGDDFFFNGYFDSIIQNNELFFDYLWRQGVCKNMNASFLLKKLNLID